MLTHLKQLISFRAIEIVKTYLLRNYKYNPKATNQKKLLITLILSISAMHSNQNCIHEKVMPRLNSGNSCCRAVQNLLSSRLLYKNVKIKVYKKSKAVPLHAMKAPGGGGRYSSYSYLTSALDGGEWSALRPGRALPPGKGSPVPIG
jgi:hypothetical protein